MPDKLRNFAALSTVQALAPRLEFDCELRTMSLPTSFAALPKMASIRVDSLSCVVFGWYNIYHKKLTKSFGSKHSSAGHCWSLDWDAVSLYRGFLPKAEDYRLVAIGP